MAESRRTEPVLAAPAEEPPLSPGPVFETLATPSPPSPRAVEDRAAALEAAVARIPPADLAALEDLFRVRPGRIERARPVPGSAPVRTSE